jgi:3-phenylpropionate/cinnamic acid dioxygenase small subunit
MPIDDSTGESAQTAISRLMFTYVERLDDGDLDGMAELFAQATFRSLGPDGIITLTGAAEIRAAFAASVRMHGGKPATQHVTTNLIIDEDRAGGRALARSVFTVVQATDRLPLQVVVAGRYRDEFVRVDGRWRFADRLVDIRLIGDVSEHLLVTAAPPTVPPTVTPR